MGSRRAWFGSVAALAIVGMAGPLRAQETSSEEIARLKAEIAAREQAIAEQYAFQQRQLTELKALVAQLEAATSENTPMRTTDVVGYDPKPAAASGIPPSRNSFEGGPYGDTTCAMRTVRLDEIKDTALRAQFENSADPTPNETSEGFRPISPELSAAVRADPWLLGKCDSQQITGKPAEVKRPWARVLSGWFDIGGVAAPIPGRPLQTGGIKPTLELGKTSAATLGITVPISMRTRDTRICKSIDYAADEKAASGKKALGVECASGFRPAVLSPFVELSTPLDKGEGSIFTATNDGKDDTDGSNFADGIAIKAGWDLLTFRGVHYYETERAIDELLDKAVVSCVRAVRAGRDPTKPLGDASDELVCARETVIDWVLALKMDPTTRSGFVHEREELAAQLLNLMWRAPEKAIPRGGFGGSVKYSSTNYTFRQAIVADLPDADGEIGVVPTFGVPLAGERTQRTDNFEVEAHGLIYWDLMGHGVRSRTGAGKVPGLMFVPGIEYSSAYAFAEKAKLPNCKFDTTIAVVDCTDVQIDRPRRRKLTSASLETRGQFINIPSLDKIGFAPKISYRLEDKGWTFDLPLYFTTKGEFSSGVRLRHTTGHNDLFGNDLDSQWNISVFFTPLTFTGFGD